MNRIIIPGAINGIDLCGIQHSKAFSAQAIADAGFEFAYVKSSQYSRTRDFLYETLVEKLQAAGIWCGAYHFCSHDTDADSQAEFFYSASNGLGKNPGELPPMADWEFCTPSHYTPPKYPLGHPKHCVDWIERFVSRCDELWWKGNAYRAVPRSTVIYTYPHYAGGHQPPLAASVRLQEHPLCYASYHHKKAYVPEASSEVPFHRVPLPWTAPVLVQYSGDTGAKVPGVQGACDRQVFTGTREDWDKFRGVWREPSKVEGKAAIDEVGRV